MASDDERPEFLVAYDYGTGGLWAILLARSADEITARYPEVAIADRPAWMSDGHLDQMRARREDIDDPKPGDLIWAVLADRDRSD